MPSLQDETFEVFFTVVFEATQGTPAPATITIVDDDPQGEPWVDQK